MRCLTQASQFELALYAYQESVLALNPCNEKGPGNTWTCQKKHRWYHKQPLQLLKPGTWFTDPKKSFLLKSLESRFNFVKAVATHGTDIILFDNEAFNKELNLLPFAPNNLELKYHVHAYDAAYRDYLTACESGKSTQVSEPVIEHFRKAPPSK
ncbi:hypothetical protein [Thalassomonas sp. RHCl1]|uniref:hypothetical protein n=1 Tax=Thalassomonas sp. RHCl1 TaxID=2995320 RepID=UPI00248CFD65|nr:hypothetical protein [Thalassomonas sp. RHCl1]